MARRVYITNPQVSLGGVPDQWILCFSALVCDDGLPAVLHPPCNEDTLVFMTFTDTAGTARAKIIDAVVAQYGVTSNDVYFIPEIGTGA